MPHGINFTEKSTGPRALVTAATAVLGLIAVSTDADADVFPAKQPVLITNVRSAIADAGVNGTLVKSLTAISEICSPQIVVIRVAAEADIPAAITAMASAQSVVKVKPRILGIPGHDTQAYTTSLVAEGKKLRAMTYASCYGCDTIAEALDYRDEFADRELELIYGDLSGWTGNAIARAMALRALIDQQKGWHYSLSNHAIPGATGVTIPISWNMQGVGTDAAALNDGPITAIIHNTGYRFWGNKTCSDDPNYAFEVAVRTNFVIQDTIDEGLLWAIDKPLDANLVKDILDSVNAKFRSMKAAGQVMGAECWFDPALNSATDLAAGKLRLSYKFTPCSPLEDLGFDSYITDSYYADLAGQIAA